MVAAAHTLVLFRHGKSDWSGGESDARRPLVKRGRRQAREAGRWLAASRHRVDLAVVSPAVRARTTWEIAAAELAVPPPTRVDERVYGAPATRLLDVVRELPEDVDTVLLVGHNPGLEDLASLLTDREIPMPTSAVAVLAVPGRWSSVDQARLLASGRPPP